MTKKLQTNQCNRILEEYREHPYYKLCLSVFDVFQESCSTIVMTPEQLFVDAVHTLNIILQSNGMSEDVCKRLWTNTINLYKERDGISCGKEETKCEVAMLFYSLMYALLTINDSGYRCTLFNILHEVIWKFYGGDSNPNKCLTVEKKMRPVVNMHANDMYAWMDDYFVSVNRLTKDIDSVIKPAKVNGKTKSSISKKNEPVYYTLNYLCENEELRIKRIGFVRRKWEEWGWIEVNTDVGDFEHFFDGKPRDCQLKWNAKNSILSLLLTKLLDDEDCFGHIVGCSPRSVVINQFKKSYDRHVERVDELDRLKIDWTHRLLNYKDALKFPQLPFHQGEDISDKALQEVFAGNMHLTKDLNKSNY